MYKFNVICGDRPKEQWNDGLTISTQKLTNARLIGKMIDSIDLKHEIFVLTQHASINTKSKYQYCYSFTNNTIHQPPTDWVTLFFYKSLSLTPSIITMRAVDLIINRWSLDVLFSGLHHKSYDINVTDGLVRVGKISFSFSCGQSRSRLRCQPWIQILVLTSYFCLKIKWDSVWHFSPQEDSRCHNHKWIWRIHCTKV